MSPAGASATAVADPPASSLEIFGRWLFLAGLAGLLGAGASTLARFGSQREWTIGAAAWLLSSVGLLLLADGQRRTAAASIAALLRTSIGQALAWRAVAVAAAGAALIVARVSPARLRQGMAGAAVAAISAVVVHVAAGHAAAGRWPRVATIGTQTIHFAAAGVWLGGLAALFAGLRGAPSHEKTKAARRFSSIAAASLLIVAGTGLFRAFNEVTSWSALQSTSYGQLLLAKIALFAVIAAIGAFNRWQSLPLAPVSLSYLRLAGGGEVAVAAVTLAATALLGTLAPPAASALGGPPGLTASGSDFATSVRVDLTTASDQPGANRFVVHAVDYDAKTPVRARRISLRFTSLDDPDVESTTLDLAPGPADAYVGSGPNMEFDGRWRVSVLIERAADSTEVPLELETRIAPRWTTTQRPPGRAPVYTVEMTNQALFEFSPDPERAGPAKLYVSCLDFIGDPKDIESMIVTAAAGGSAAQLPVKRLGPGRFVADIVLHAGGNRVAAVARTTDGTRIRASLAFDVAR